MIKFYNQILILMIFLIFVNGCSSTDSKFTSTQDPYEKTNREIFKFNQKFDEYILKPTSDGYKKSFPKKVRNGISNHLKWVSTPTTIINSGLQLEAENFSLSTINFLLNSLTFGFYDLDDKETKFHKLDFGSTMASYNFSEGPYLIIPFFGPRTLRHLTGNLMDTSVSNSVEPNNFQDIKKYEIPINAIDTRTSLSNVFEDVNSSADPYFKLRSLYLQNRRNKLLLSKDYENKLIKEEEEEFEKLLQ